MSTCKACGVDVANNGRFCSSCGTPVIVGDEVATFDFAPATPLQSQQRSASASRPPSSAFPREGLFLPGSMVSGRYRIITLLGKGGMGEVFRADDLTLGQSVALKFLPPGLARDPDLLARFRAEVRTARQVSHPHVCRVYDVGEADGQPFLTMEYIDGEDLDALLRRIGRLPEEKGIELARQLCLGLAAAHDPGGIHPGLNPGNLMIDGGGQGR